jgi:hypothetical protein
MHVAQKLISTASWSFSASLRVKVFPSLSVTVKSGNGFPRKSFVASAPAMLTHSASTIINNYAIAFFIYSFLPDQNQYHILYFETRSKSRRKKRCGKTWLFRSIKQYTTTD